MKRGRAPRAAVRLMAARVYVVPISHPAAAAVAMLRHKRIPHRALVLMPGLHPLLVRFAGFQRHTVPALELDGRKVQGSREIARFLDVVRPEPPLFPSDTRERERVEEAERWGERVFQPVPRRLFRYLLATSERARMWMGRGVLRMPAARVMQWAFLPVIRRLAKLSHANEAQIREDLVRLPELLDHVDALIADGTIGGAEPNAADFQILATVRVLLEFEDVAEELTGRPCVPLARQLYPEWRGPVPRLLPQLSDGSAGIVAISR
jgi:glutathione S-transferase